MYTDGPLHLSEAVYRIILVNSVTDMNSMSEDVKFASVVSIITPCGSNTVAVSKRYVFRFVEKLGSKYGVPLVSPISADYFFFFIIELEANVLHF